MTANQFVGVHVDGSVNEEASAVLASMGLSLSDAFRMLLTRVARDKALPFEPYVPNDTTIAAMRESLAGNLRRCNSVESLLDALHEDD